MIAIIDNGESYSEHVIYFIDIGDENPDKVLPLLVSIVARDEKKTKVLAIVERVGFREPDAIDPISAYCKLRWHNKDCPVADFYAERLASVPAGVSYADCVKAFNNTPWPQDKIQCMCAVGALQRVVNEV